MWLEKGQFLPIFHNFHCWIATQFAVYRIVIGGIARHLRSKLTIFIAGMPRNLRSIAL
jgi:hypothetical protein